MASILLKNSVKKQWSLITDDVKAYVKDFAVKTLSDPMERIRDICGGIISSVVKEIGLHEWKGLVEYLINLTTGNDANAIKGAFSTLETLCDEHKTQLEKDDSLPLLVEKLVEHLKNPDALSREYSLKCINHLIPWKLKPLLDRMEPFLDALFYLAQYDDSKNVKLQVCRSFTQLVEANLRHLYPHIQGIINYMLMMTNNEDKDIAIVASNFWKYVSEFDDSEDAIIVVFPDLIKTLLFGLRMSEEEILNFEIEEETGGDQEMNSNQIKGEKWDIGSSDDSRMNMSGLSLRKSCASGIDALSYMFSEKIIPVFLPILEEFLNSPDWINREAGVLSFGAITPGCGEHLYQYLPTIVPYIMQLLNDENAAIRSMACWALGRCSKWIISVKEGNQFFIPFINGILLKLSDSSQSTQESAFCAISYFMDYAQNLMAGYTKDFLVACFTVYPTLSSKNAIVFYDSISTLADAVGSEIAKPEYISIYMNPFSQRFNELRDDDTRLIPLMECLTTLAGTMGSSFLPYVDFMIERALRMMETYFMEQNLYRQEPYKHFPPDSRFMVCALDLISGISEGIHSTIYEYLKGTNIANLVVHACRDEDYSIKKSAFGLVGDLTRFSIPIILPVLPDALPFVVQEIKPRIYKVSVSNNSTWAFGEIAFRAPDLVAPYALHAQERLTRVLNDQMLLPDLYENAAVTLGRLALAAPQQLAPNFESFYKPFCISLSQIPDDLEKDSAFRGLYSLVKLNPLPAFKDFEPLCEAIASWAEPKQDLKEMSHGILLAFKSQYGSYWKDLFNQLSFHLKKCLVDMYSDLSN